MYKRKYSDWLGEYGMKTETLLKVGDQIINLSEIRHISKANGQTFILYKGKEKFIYIDNENIFDSISDYFFKNDEEK